jgi:phosphoribosylformimino-5-aminoimidazole carboxamide ribotide isomerase
MLILPAIDLKAGRAVRLLQGRTDQETRYSDDPVAVARDFATGGAKMLHVVDLDGAFQGRSANREVIRAIREAVPIPIEAGGGMRSLADIKAMLDLGIDSVVVGTLAVRDPVATQTALERFGADRIQLGIDARNGKVAVRGWEENTAHDAVEFALAWKARGVRRVIFTDIARDGMLQGPNLPSIRRLAEATGLQVTASGGVSSKADIDALRILEPLGVDRVIVGKALYEGKVALAEVC